MQAGQFPAPHLLLRVECRVPVSGRQGRRDLLLPVLLQQSLRAGWLDHLKPGPGRTNFPSLYLPLPPPDYMFSRGSLAQSGHLCQPGASVLRASLTYPPLGSQGFCEGLCQDSGPCLHRGSSVMTTVIRSVAIPSYSTCSLW